MPVQPETYEGDPAFDVAHLCRNFSELSPQPMIAVEGATHIVRYANSAFSRLVGKKRSELMGRSFAEAVPEGEENGCLALLDRVYRTGTPEVLYEQEHGKTPAGSLVLFGVGYTGTG
jgi:PAS domain S-box-containing protein